MSRTSLLISIIIATLVTGAVSQVADSGPVTMQSPMLAAMPPKAGMSVQVENVDLTPVTGDVSMVNLNEEHITDVPRVGAGVPIAARRNEIVSLRFRRQ